MADAFDVLGHDHDEVKRMLSELDSGPTAATGADGNQSQLRKNMTEQLIIEESKHEAVEEEYFWPAVRERLPDGQELADEALRQEQDAKVLLDKLDTLDAGDEVFERLLGAAAAAADRARDAATGRGE